MNLARRIARVCIIGMCLLLLTACSEDKPYGRQGVQQLPGKKRQTWAVAPVINMSGQRQVDPLLQADLLYTQLQQVEGITAVPVNRVVELYTRLRIEKVNSEEQAAQVCQYLGCDALLVGTVTIYDPYYPPKMGASLQLLYREGPAAKAHVDARAMARSGSAAPTDLGLPAGGSFVQAVGLYDAANGTVREEAFRYATGRNDPMGPYGEKEYLVDMDRYGGFVYHSLIAAILRSPQVQR